MLAIPSVRDGMVLTCFVSPQNSLRLITWPVATDRLGTVVLVVRVDLLESIRRRCVGLELADCARLCAAPLRRRLVLGLVQHVIDPHWFSLPLQSHISFVPDSDSLLLAGVWIL